MSKFIIKIFIGLLTFSLGTSTSLLWSLFATLPQVDEVQENKIWSCQFAPIEITACQVLDIPPSYNDKWISIEATVHIYNKKIVMLPIKACYEVVGDDFQMIFPVLELKNFVGANADLKDVLEKQTLKHSETKEVDIKVIGTVKRYYDKNKKAQYSIIPDSIELLSPIRKLSPGGAA